MLRALLLALVCASCSGPAAAPPAEAPKGPLVTVVNDSGEEVRDVYLVSFPSGKTFPGAPVAAMKAGETRSFAWPGEPGSKLSVMFLRKPDIKVEKTVMTLSGEATVTLKPGGKIGASMAP